LRDRFIYSLTQTLNRSRAGEIHKAKEAHVSVQHQSIVQKPFVSSQATTGAIINTSNHAQETNSDRLFLLAASSHCPFSGNLWPCLGLDLRARWHRQDHSDNIQFSCNCWTVVFRPPTIQKKMSLELTILVIGTLLIFAMVVILGYYDTRSLDKAKKRS